MTMVAERIAPPTQADADLLCREDSAWCVSLYMPIRNDWGDLVQNTIRLKNLVRSAEKRLEALGLEGVHRKDVLDPVQSVLQGDRSLRLPVGGIGAFLTPDDARLYWLPGVGSELLYVGSRFHVRPVLDAVADDRRCVVLALGLGGVRLLDCSPTEVADLALGDVPMSLADSLEDFVFESHRQYHSGSARRGAGQGVSLQVHGQGASADRARAKKQILEYFRRIAGGVAAAMADRSDPLVVVGLPHLVGLYREANRYVALWPDAVLTDPDSLSVEALRDRALGALSPEHRRRRDRILDRIRSVRPGLAARRLADVLDASMGGRVEILVAARGRHAWGRYADGTEPVVHSGRRAGDQDLVDLAAWHTVRTGGQYLPVESDLVPGAGPVAALLRY